MTFAVRQFLEKPSLSLLRDEKFVLRLESEMLFPGYTSSKPHPEYMLYLALGAGPAPMPSEFPPPLQRNMPAPPSMGGYTRRLREIDPEPILPYPPNICLKPNSKEVLRHRVALDSALAKVTQKQIYSAHRNRVIDGHLSAMFLDMLRLLHNSELKTKAGVQARPSINIVAFVLQEHNLGRPRLKRGRPSAGSDEYPTLDEQRLKVLWRERRSQSSLWAAFRAASSSKWDTPIAPKNLLCSCDAAEFIRLSAQYEVARVSLQEVRSSVSQDAFGPEEAFEDLRAVLHKHVPEYRVT